MAATQLYPKGRQKFLEGLIHWSATDTFKVYLIDEATYVVNFTTDEFASTIDTSGGDIATSAALTGLTSTDGVANANDAVFTAVAGPTTAEALVIWKDTAVLSSSPLLVYMDEAQVTGLPITPNGSDLTVQWGETNDKIFVLGPTTV